MFERYRHDIDGLRALAVIAVILFHMRIDGIIGGFAGVDVFFVISGYLITSILVKKTDNFKEFYIKRIRRIMPPMLAMIIFSLIVTSILYSATELASVAKQGIAALFSFSNIYTLLVSADYWSESAEQMVFLHLWSLSLEEQFYLIFPFVVFLFRKNLNKLPKVVFLFILISFSVCVLLTPHYRSEAFYLLPTRAWELMIGAYCALSYKTCLSVKKSTILSSLGLVLVLSSFFLIEEQNFPGWKAFLPVLGTALLLVGGMREENYVSKALNYKAIGWIGKLSYSLYLWHWPVIVISAYISDNFGYKINDLTQTVVIFALSIFSYYCVEKPLRFGKKWKFALSALFTLAVAMCGVIYFFPKSEQTSQNFKCTWDGMKYNCVPDIYSNKPMRGITVNYSSDWTKNSYAEGIEFKYNQTGVGKTRIVVFGDSHAVMWGETLNAISRELGCDIVFFCATGTPSITGDKIRSGNSFTREQKNQYDTARINLMNEMKADDILILVNRWDHIPQKNLIAEFYRSIPENIKNVLVFEQPPVLSIGHRSTQPIALTRAKWGIDINLCDIDKKWLKIGSNQSAKNIAKANLINKNIYFFETNTLFTKDNKALFSNDNNLYYVDDDHLSTEGTLFAKDKLKEMLNGIIQSRHK